MYFDDKEKTYNFILNTAIGDILLAERGGYIIMSSFSQMPVEGTFQQTDLLRAASLQLDEYFCGKRKRFDLPIRTIGTKFQQEVLNEFIKIPYGQTRSYAEMARGIGKEKAARAVGNAAGANKLAILIPCHRVIHSSGDISGFSSGNQRKKFLLDLEKKYMGFLA
ncbi:MAG: methylated-DNA--[protein]-cysteine S-methyltransferase [Eubacteriales bacterium]